MRRGRGGKVGEISMYYNNINSISSKRESLAKIIEEVRPDVICLCETKIGNLSTVETLLPKYKVIGRCVKYGQGGVLIAARKEAYSLFLDVTVSENKNIVAGRLRIGSHTLRIVVGYAPQETDEEELSEELYTDLAIEVQRGVANGEYPILVGDMNAKLDVVKRSGLLNPMSRNGSILMDTLITTCNLEVVNFTEKCTGKWTHVIRTTGESSILDYIMVPDTSKVKEMTIDESTIMCPFRTVSEKGQKKKVLSDHNAIVVNFHMPYEKGVQGRSEELITKDKWFLTEEGLENIEAAVQEELELRYVCRPLPGVNAQEKYNDLEMLLDSVMDKCFKRAVPKKRKNKELTSPKYVEISKRINQLSKKGKVQREVARGYRNRIMKLNEEAVAEKKAEVMEKIVEEMVSNGEFSSQGFYKLRRAMKNKSPICTSVVNTEGQEVYGDTGIKETYLSEFQDRLSPGEITSGFESIKSKTELLCKMVLEECALMTEENFSIDELEDVESLLKKGKAAGLDRYPAELFTRGKNSLNNELLSILNEVKNELISPKQWNQVEIITLYKNKGSRKSLVNHRGIFLTSVISKIFERLIMSRVKETITKNMSRMQAGGTAGRATYDNVFLLRSAITHAKYMDTPLYVTLYDFKQCFDKLWLEDSILSLWKLGVKSDLLPMVYKMNEESTITVRTPIGNTEKFDIPAICKQGTVLIPPMCSASVAECCNEQKRGGASIGAFTLKSLAFMDDLLGINTTIRDVHTSHNQVTFFSKKKKAPLNEDKCICLIVNDKSPYPQPVLFVNDKQIKIEGVAKYLGDLFNSRGNNDALLDDRGKTATRCLVTCLAECYAVTRGCKALESLLLLYKCVYIQSILFNSEAWDNLSEKDLGKLRVMQMKFLKRMLQVSKSAPNCLVMLELGVLPIEFKIFSRQLNFLHHILALEDDDPVKLSYRQQKLFPYENNWVKGIKETMIRCNIKKTEDEITEMTKSQWKELVDRKTRESAFTELLRAKSKLKKGSNLQYETLEVQSYFKFLNLQDARTIFKVRTEMYDFKENKHFKYDDANCRLCGEDPEDAHHVANVCRQMPDNCRRMINLTDGNEESVQEIIRRVAMFENLIK